MERWIFQDIKDIKTNVLYANYNNGKSLKDSITLYNEELRKKIDPKLYVQYIINGFDIYLDVMMVIVSAQNVYPDLTENQILKWIMQDKRPMHILC